MFLLTLVIALQLQVNFSSAYRGLLHGFSSLNGFVQSLSRN